MDFMTKLETNALRIAELKGYQEPNTEIENAVIITPTVMENFMRYNGLMPIVFECNKSELDVTIDISMNDVVVTQYKSNYKNIFTYGIYQENEFIKSENTFIEAIQLACIKYLELKNEH